MRGTAVRVLDERYLEFLGVLRDLGELDGLVQLIAELSAEGVRSFDDSRGADTGLILPEMNRAVHAFWMMGWIELREITRKSKYGLKTNFSLKVCLDKIADHFEQERLRRSLPAVEAFRPHKVPATA